MCRRRRFSSDRRKRLDAALLVLTFETLVRLTNVPNGSDDVSHRFVLIFRLELELGEHIVRLHLIGSLHNQPVIEEDIEARANDATLPDLLPPPRSPRTAANRAREVPRRQVQLPSRSAGRSS